MNDVLKEPQKCRFAFIDNIRSLVIILVIAMHSAVTYSGMGSWYYVEGSTDRLSVFEMVFFGFFQSFLQAWIMGILFFISAYLASKALAKHGPVKFIKERLFRLGLPLLLYVFIISPFILFVLMGYNAESSFVDNYILYIKDFWWLGSTGPLWYVQVLLIFCILYTVAKKCILKTVKLSNIRITGTGIGLVRQPGWLSHKSGIFYGKAIKKCWFSKEVVQKLKFPNNSIIITIFATALIAFFVRIKIPIGSSFYNLQFAYFPSYIVMFIAGLLTGENNLLEEVANEKNAKWLKISLLVGIPLWTSTMILGGALEGKEYFNGGLHWQNFTFALWESLTAVGFSIGLISLFKKKTNIENKFTGLMRDNAFGMYFFHAPVLITVSLALKFLNLCPILKFAAVLLLASAFSLLLSFLARSIKPIGKILK
ncbi:MAG: acyltransferase [Treponema sp.]|nr:acyltransferase [Treponema sp.]